MALPLALLAQEKPKLRYGLDISKSYGKIQSSERLELELGLNATYKSNVFRLSPIIQTYSSEAQNDPKNWQITGVGLGYFRQLKTQSERFSLIFRLESTLQQYGYEWSGTFFDVNQQEYVAYRYESNELFSANTVAYGFTFNCSKGLYLRTLVAAGVYFSNIKGEREDTPVPTNVRVDFRGYGNSGFFWKSSIGIGYNF